MKPAPAHRPRTARPGIRILHVTPEAAPFARTGGLGDVAGALASAQAATGAEVALLMPLYRDLHADPGPLELHLEIAGASILRRSEPWGGVSIFFVRHDPSFAREGLYGTTAGDYADNAARFSWLAEAALALALRERPDVMHLHDWQAALVSVLLQARPEVRARLPALRTLQSIHNLGYQGHAPRGLLAMLGLPATFGDGRLLGDGDALNLLKGGLLCADALATVSGRYVAEMQTEAYGRGLDPILRGRKAELFGVLNGIDMQAYDPAHDAALAAPYSARNPRGKAACRRALLRDLGLAGGEGEPIVGFVGRMVEQKGIDLLLQALPDLCRIARVVIVGSGDAGHERAVLDAVGAFPGRLAARIGFDDRQARLCFAGSDLCLVPSRYEPCGLVQMYAMRYGALPVAHRVGGLAETIRDGKTGFLFSPFESRHMLRAFSRAVQALQDPARRAGLIRAAMERDFSWTKSVAAYARLYRKVQRSPAREVELLVSSRPQAVASSNGTGIAAMSQSVARMVEPGTATRPPSAPPTPHVALLAQGPRRLYGYWETARDATPMITPRVECLETGLTTPIAGRMPTGDGWFHAEPERHYRVVVGSLATSWVRTPPDLTLPIEPTTSRRG